MCVCGCVAAMLCLCSFPGVSSIVEAKLERGLRGELYPEECVAAAAVPVRLWPCLSERGWARACRAGTCKICARTRSCCCRCGGAAVVLFLPLPLLRVC